MSPLILCQAREPQPAPEGDGDGWVKETVPLDFDSNLDSSLVSPDEDDRSSDAEAPVDADAEELAALPDRRPSTSSAYCCKMSRWRFVKDLK